MHAYAKLTSPSRPRLLSSVGIAGALLSFLLTACAWQRAHAAETQKHFTTPEEAAEALIAALKADDSKALLAIFGENAKDLVESGDPVADTAIRADVVERYEQAHSLEKQKDGSVVLEMGNNEWPFPIPLVKAGESWRFDTAAGQEEVIARRIGRNELSAIQVCLAYVDAQREYYSRNPDGDPLLHYATKVASAPGKHDGLFWETAAGEPPSPLGPFIARARAEGYEGKGKGRPYHGYYYRVLTAQGPAAAGGAYSYLAGDKMIGGFALIAYPADYDNSGVMSFIVNHDGVVYQKDLGPETATAAAQISEFNPDATWTRVDDADL